MILPLELPPPDELLGREDELKELDAWVEDPGGAFVFAITGAPGTGKSSILRKWLDRRQGVPERERGERIIAHWILPEQEPAAVVHSLRLMSADLAVGAGRQGAPMPLYEALSQAAGSGSLIVVVDALERAADSSRLRALLSAGLSERVRLVCTSGPRRDPGVGFGAGVSVHCIDLDSASGAASNEAICREFWLHKRCEADWLSAVQIEEVLRRGRGSMLHSVLLWRLLCDVPADRRQSLISSDIDALVAHAWQRLDALADDRRALLRDALAVLALACEPLKMQLIEELAVWPAPAPREPVPYDRFGLLEHARTLLAVDHGEQISLFHPALAERVLRFHGAIHDRDRFLRRMVPVLMEWLKHENRRRDFAERHILRQCIRAECWSEAIDLCLTPDFYRGWLRRDWESLAQQVTQIKGQTRARDHEMHFQRLELALREGQDRWSEACEAIARIAPRTWACRHMLVVTANPADLDSLRVDKEQRNIKAVWKRRRSLLRFEFCPAATIDDLREALSEGEHDILHVACHGSDGRLRFEREPDAPASGPDDIPRLIRALGDSLKLVFFNACESAELAKRLALLLGIPLAVGMEGSPTDDSALQFAGAFYAHLADGLPVQQAYDGALARITYAKDRACPQLFVGQAGAGEAILFPRRQGGPAFAT